MNGQWLESKERHANLKESDVDTVVRFSQFAYTGDYKSAEPDLIVRAAASDHVEPATDIFKKLQDRPMTKEEDTWCFGATKDKRKKKKDLLWEEFSQSGNRSTVPTCQILGEQHDYKDYTNVFLCHARVYVFADQYDIGSLATMALRKLRKTLVEHTLYKDRADSIFDLIQYSYTNTPDPSSSIDRLRELVLLYSTCVVEDLAREARFLPFLAEVESFRDDLMMSMLKRLD